MPIIRTAREEATATTHAEHFNIAYIYAISLVAALGGLLFGYDWVVIGGAKPFYEKVFHLTDASQHRGRLVSLNQLTIVIGILLAQVVNWLIAKPVPADATALQILQSWNGQVGWRWMFGVTAVPAVLFFLSMFVVPESPRWLAKNGAREKAKHVLSRIGGDSYGTHALGEIEGTVTRETKQVGLRMLFDRRMLRVLFLGAVLAVVQQWGGIHVIFNYAAV